MSPDVTVVITTHNRRALLPDAVESVRSQADVDAELIVVDDGSTDGTRAWIEANLTRPRERFLLRPAAGRPTASNAALPHVRGHHLLFLDDDDALLPGALARLHAALDAAPGASAAIGARLRHGSRIAHPARAMVREASLDLIASWGPVPGQVLMRTDLAREVGGFADAFPAEDLALFLGLAGRGPFALVPDPVLHYRVHPGQSRKPGNLKQVRHGLSARAAQDLPAIRRRDSAAAWAAGQRRQRAELARERGCPARALALYAGAALTSPSVARSPVVWPLLAHGMVDAGRQLLARRSSDGPANRGVPRAAGA